MHFYRQIKNPAMERLAVKQIRQLAEAAIEADEEETKRDVEDARIPIEAARSRRN